MDADTLGLIQQLAARIDKLETSAAASQTEELSANYLTVNPATGQVGALFTGGVQMPEGKFGVADASVTWVDPAGAIHEAITGGASGPLHALTLGPQDPAVGTPESAQFQMFQDTSGASITGISAQMAHGGSSASTWVLDSQGRSTYPMMAGNNPTKTLISFGIFTTDGLGTINNSGSGDWTLSANTAGQSTVNFATRKFNPVCVATINPAGAFNGWAEVNNQGPSSCIIDTLNDSGNVLKAAVVNFIVIGV